MKLQKPTEQEIEVVARTIYGEARGEYRSHTSGIVGLMAVGNVICNRVLRQTWYGKTIEQVCLKPWQFSCWNKNDPNYKLLKAETIEDPIFKKCREVAEGVLTTWPDVTKGATHYHVHGIPLPEWAKEVNPHLKLGKHVFYTLN